MLVPNSSNTAGFGGGDVKPCVSIVILCLLCALRYYIKADTLDIILMYKLLKSIHIELSYEQQYSKTNEKIIKMFNLGSISCYKH